MFGWLLGKPAPRALPKARLGTAEKAVLRKVGGGKVVAIINLNTNRQSAPGNVKRWPPSHRAALKRLRERGLIRYSIEAGPSPFQFVYARQA